MDGCYNASGQIENNDTYSMSSSTSLLYKQGGKEEAKPQLNVFIWLAILTPNEYYN